MIVAVSLVGVLVPRARPVRAGRTLDRSLGAAGDRPRPLRRDCGHAPRTRFLLTRRAADLAVVVGLVLLSARSTARSRSPSWTSAGGSATCSSWSGSRSSAASVAYDLRRGSQSRPLVGDLRASEIVAAEEAFLGARVRALMVRLAEKDTSTEEHTRRVAALAVEVGEQLGLSSTRLRALAIGGLLHDVGKLSVPTSILQKPGPLDDDEFAIIKLHPERGRELLSELGGFDDSVKRLVLDHHERLDGTGYPRGLEADELDLETRILAVCDVYDALVSPASTALPGHTSAPAPCCGARPSTAFDPRCVQALLQVVAGRRVPEQIAS